MQSSGDTGSTRLIGLDYLRGFIIVLVVLHHAVLAYCTFGQFNPTHYTWSSAPIVDSERWSGFDVIVLFNDSYFMPLMFLLSGAFVKPSLGRYGPTAYLLNRTRRLAVPFALTVLTLMPLAYYPSYRMTGATIGFDAFWVQTVFHGPWPSGPPWFIAVLFVFDLLAVAAHKWLGRLTLAQGKVSFALLVTVSLVAFLPLLILRGPARWFTWGPFAIQQSRVLLYAAYFFVGVAAGPAMRIATRRPILLAVALFLPLLAMEIALLHDPRLLSPLYWVILYGVTFALFCTATTRALLAVFSRIKRRSAIWDNLSANAYGIYLVHYVFVVWIQYALLDSQIGAVPKAICTFTAALALSWVCSAAAGTLMRALRIMGFRRR